MFDGAIVGGVLPVMKIGEGIQGRNLMGHAKFIFPSHYYFFNLSIIRER